jgi:hypothetical protein
MLTPLDGAGRSVATRRAVLLTTSVQREPWAQVPSAVIGWVLLPSALDAAKALRRAIADTAHGLDLYSGRELRAWLADPRGSDDVNTTLSAGRTYEVELCAAEPRLLTARWVTVLAMDTRTLSRCAAVMLQGRRRAGEGRLSGGAARAGPSPRSVI